VSWKVEIHALRSLQLVRPLSSRGPFDTKCAVGWGEPAWAEDRSRVDSAVPRVREVREAICPIGYVDRRSWDHRADRIPLHSRLAQFIECSLSLAADATAEGATGFASVFANTGQVNHTAKVCASLHAAAATEFEHYLQREWANGLPRPQFRYSQRQILPLDKISRTMYTYVSFYPFFGNSADYTYPYRPAN
jgi:hypothetical protein